MAQTKDRLVSFRMTEAEYADLAQLAEERAESVGGTIRWVIQEHKEERALMSDVAVLKAIEAKIDKIALELGVIGESDLYECERCGRPIDRFRMEILQFTPPDRWHCRQCEYETQREKQHGEKPVTTLQDKP